MNNSLTAAERVNIARHPQRPNISDYIGALFTDFFEQKGDRLCGEDAAILGGVALYHGRPVTVIGTRKGKTLEENLKCNFGMPNPEGYRKALRLMKHCFPNSVRPAQSLTARNNSITTKRIFPLLVTCVSVSGLWVRYSFASAFPRSINPNTLLALRQKRKSSPLKICGIR